MGFQIHAGEVSIFFDRQAKPAKIKLFGQSFNQPAHIVSYGLWGKKAKVRRIASKKEGKLTAYLEVEEKEAVFRAETSRNGIKLALRSLTDDRSCYAHLTLFFPEELKIYFPGTPVGFTSGMSARLFDRRMPVGSTFATPETEHGSKGLSHQLILVESDRGCLCLTNRSDLREVFSLDVRGLAYPRIKISRSVEGFSFTYYWPSAVPLFLRSFPSLQEAVRDYKQWMENTFNLIPLEQNSGLPDWFFNTKLIITLDMWRSNGQIAHNYQHLIDLCKDMRKARAPKDTLFYLPGWNYKYDAHYPEYSPTPELGGPKKFKQMVDTAHECGYRIMVHTMPCGVDPYLPQFEITKKWVKKGHIFANYAGWPGGSKVLKYDWEGKKEQISGTMVDNSILFPTITIPEKCEAKLVIGGLSGFGGQIKITVGERRLESPPQWFMKNDSYTFPFPFFFKAGTNQVHLKFTEAELTKDMNIWYQIVDCFHFAPIWTYPFVGTELSNPEWASYFTGRVSSLVQQFDIDAVHLDAHILGGTSWEGTELFNQLRKQIPKTVFSCEVFDEPAMSFFSLIQNGEILTNKELNEWRNQYTPIFSNLILDYVKLYPHLCVPEGLVPVAKVCNIEKPPTEVSEEQRKRIREVVMNAGKYGVIPNLRLNYKDYGLDQETKQVIAQLVASF